MQQDDKQGPTGADGASVDGGAQAEGRKPGELSLEELAKVAGGRVSGGFFTNTTGLSPIAKNKFTISG